MPSSIREAGYTLAILEMSGIASASTIAMSVQRQLEMQDLGFHFQFRASRPRQTRKHWKQIFMKILVNFCGAAKFLLERCSRKLEFHLNLKISRWCDRCPTLRCRGALRDKAAQRP